MNSDCEDRRDRTNGEDRSEEAGDDDLREGAADFGDATRGAARQAVGHQVARGKEAEHPAA